MSGLRHSSLNVGLQRAAEKLVESSIREPAAARKQKMDVDASTFVRTVEQREARRLREVERCSSGGGGSGLTRHAEALKAEVGMFRQARQMAENEQLSQMAAELKELRCVSKSVMDAAIVVANSIFLRLLQTGGHR